jgi:hypothetical protein
MDGSLAASRSISAAPLLNAVPAALKPRKWQAYIRRTPQMTAEYSILKHRDVFLQAKRIMPSELPFSRAALKKERANKLHTMLWP